MKISLSILLPSYNNECLTVVKDLKSQADALDGLDYEIIVADDGGDINEIKETNSTINTFENCRYIIRNKNVGRASIRNFLSKEAKKEWLLFIDSDCCIIRSNFILSYIKTIEQYKQQLICIDGGVSVVGNPATLRQNLRFWYEYKAQHLHTAERRSKKPNKHIHTANLLVPRIMMMKKEEGGYGIIFDERFNRYGYEDVLFGKQIFEADIPIIHIEAPVGLDKFESNISFVNKTEESLTTLHRFRNELSGYSILLDNVNKLKAIHLIWVIRLFHSLFHSIERENLLSKHPSLLLFKLYKLGFYCSIK